MKRILRVGEGYALTKHKRKLYTIRYLSLLAVLTTMCLYAVKQVSAQEAEPAATAVAGIKPLQIGDTIPEWLWHHPLQVVNHPGGNDTITLNDYRDEKLIILDFWATWCKPCIQSVEHISALLSENGLSGVILLPISTYDRPSKALSFIERRNWQLPSGVNDKILCKALLSAYRGTLGVVWLKDNKLYAVPRKVSITSDNILMALESRPHAAQAITNFPLGTEGGN